MIERDPFQRQIILEYLEGAGTYRVQAAGKSDARRASAPPEEPDLVIISLEDFLESGPDFRARLRSGGTPLLILTDGPLPDDNAKVAAGLRGRSLEKPFSRRRLLIQVEESIRRSPGRGGRPPRTDLRDGSR